jgi:NAD(P)-dependent dehydrogenase (short-subunit alcohol dehydrogenase family)
MTVTTDIRPARHALVSGASSGIGEAIARRLLESGWRVTGLSRTRGGIDHPSFAFQPADLMDEDSLAAALDRIEDLDAVVHAAGILRVGAIGGLDRESGQAMWRLHLDAAAQILDHVAPRLPDGGRIVLVGSRTAAGSAGRGLYAASKSAVVGLARSLAIELAPRGVTVNVVAPGATDTPMLSDPARSGVAPRLPPIGRFVRPEEVAGLVAFLLSDDAGSITGQQILVCGGASL